ncbi:MAG: hypothetical protein ACRD1V_14800 [Vicinamibacterales bacterium]
MKAVPICAFALVLGSFASVAAAQDCGNPPDPAVCVAVNASPTRVQSGSFGYARLGYGATTATGGSAGPAFGFGYRAEIDSFGLDISFLNEQLPSSNNVPEESGASAASLLKLEALYFAKPKANATAYVGGGVGWGVTSLARTSSPDSSSTWSGSGLQGELTVGYELPRSTTMRLFVQADTSLPFYRVIGQTFTYSGLASSTAFAGRRYAPSIVVSIGMGWQRRRE